MRFKKTLGLSYVFYVLSSSSVTAATIDVINRFSSISGSIVNVETDVAQSETKQSSDFNTFNEEVIVSNTGIYCTICDVFMTSAQNSSISDNAMHYQDNLLYEQSPSGFFDVDGQSNFSLSFDVVAATNFSMDWILSAYTGNGNLVMGQRIEMTREGDTIPSFLLEANYSGLGYPYLGPYGSLTNCQPSDTTCLNPASDSFSGIIGTGRYALSITNYMIQSPNPTNSFDASSSVSFNLVLTPVPIPSAVWLFGSGLIGLVGLARRKA